MTIDIESIENIEITIKIDFFLIINSKQLSEKLGSNQKFYVMGFNSLNTSDNFYSHHIRILPRGNFWHKNIKIYSTMKIKKELNII